MANKQQEKFEIPVILYEEPSSRGEKGIPFPYIEVQKEAQMPPVLFIFEYKYTGEVEPDEEGKEAAIVDQIPHKYVDMEYLKAKLSPEDNDNVRVALGLQPLKVAQAAGQKILERVEAKKTAIETLAQKEKERKLQERAEQEKEQKKKAEKTTS